MSGSNLPLRPDLTGDLVRLTDALDREVLAFAKADAHRPVSDDKVVFAAAPGALATAAIGICAGAIWLASALPY